MSMRVILFYQHIGREYGSLIRIREELIALTGGPCAVSIRSIDFEWAKACREARQDGVDVVVVPWLYIDLNYALVTPFFEINPEVVIINIHQEQISSPSSEIVLEPKGDAEKNGCYHFVWSSYYADRLRKCGVRDGLIRVTGNARLDDLVAFKSSKGTRGELAIRYSLDSGKKWVLFAESRGWVLKDTPANKAEMLQMGVRDEDYENSKLIDAESMSLLYEQMHALPDSYFEDCELIYRAHPGTDVGKGLDSRVRQISSESIGVWLRAVDLLAMWGSTSAFEAEIYGVPVVRHEPIPNPAWHRVAGLAEYPLIDNIFQTIAAVDGDIKQPEEKVYERYFGIVDGQRARCVAESIVEVAERRPVRRPSFELDGDLKRQLFRKRVFEYTTRVVCDLNLLEKLHWPRSAYFERSDIPFYKNDVGRRA
ncbi:MULTISPECIES: hypothetical protein [unclassified Adlercreutzia]|uniref:hypothetical protein n=1 Tax=unclassified Adlercreutzia TaxID=2636013 RepID=UPI0013EA07C2|nr:MULTISPECIES: hypothetical protein [unclassified Adlercreutzia]